MNGFGEIGKNDRFGAKMALFGKKGPKSQISDLSREHFFRHFFKTKKLVSMAIISKILSRLHKITSSLFLALFT